MKASLQLAALVLSCAAFSAGGWWLAGSFPGPKEEHAASTATAEVVINPPPAVKAAEAPRGEVEIPQTTADVERKMFSRAPVEELWSSLLMGVNDVFRDRRIYDELAERLGWAAWDVALRLDDESDRSHVAEGILAALAKRDPWRAFETWRDHREEFQDDSSWGQDAKQRAMEGIGQGSAEQMIAMLEPCAEAPGWDVCRMEYRDGFDFAAVVNHLLDADDPPKTYPRNLLEEWGRQAPVAFSRWLLEHPEDLSGGGAWNWETDKETALFALARMSPETPGRAEALETLGRLPAESLKKMWSSYIPETHPDLSLPELEAATQMNQREAYLWRAFQTTLATAEIDPSWQQLPEADRQPLLEKMRQRLDEAEPSVLQKEQWNRWERRVKAGWGME